MKKKKKNHLRIILNPRLEPGFYRRRELLDRVYLEEPLPKITEDTEIIMHSILELCKTIDDLRRSMKKQPKALNHSRKFERLYIPKRGDPPRELDEDDLERKSVKEYEAFRRAQTLKTRKK
jgi:hypothetical protein